MRRRTFLSGCGAALFGAASVNAQEQGHAGALRLPEAASSSDPFASLREGKILLIRDQRCQADSLCLFEESAAGGVDLAKALLVRDAFYIGRKGILELPVSC